MKRILVAGAILLGLSGCSLLGKGGEKGPKTPLLGNRVPILTYESGAEVDPGLADQAVAIPPAQANADWAQPGGNAQKSMGHLALGTNLGKAWSVSIAGNSNKVRLGAPPAVSGDALYVMDTKGTVSSFTTVNGGLRWKTSLLGKDEEDVVYGGGASVDGGRVYATTGAGDVAALDAANGKLLWKVRPGGPLRGAPTIFNGQIYAMTQDNQIFALAADTGKVLWNEAGSLENSGIFGVAAPAGAQGTIVAGFSSGDLTAYRYENGRAVWQDALSRTSMSTTVASLSDIDASPVIDEGRVYAVGEGGRMVALELITGQRLWELNIGGIATPWIAGEWVFVMTDQAKLLCISRTSGKIRWITQLPAWHNPKKKGRPIYWVGPVLAGDRLLVASSEGQLVNVRVSDGSLGTGIRTGKPIYLSLVVAGSTLYTLDSDGHLTAWR